jgi:hypothetical protein
VRRCSPSADRWDGLILNPAYGCETHFIVLASTLFEHTGKLGRPWDAHVTICRTGGHWGHESFEMDARHLIAAAVTASISLPAFAQTQPTRPSAYATIPTLPSAFPTSPLSPCYPSFRREYRFGYLNRNRFGYFNPTSPCYSGTIYPSYSAVTPFEFPHGPSLQAALQGASRLNEAQAKLRIEAKGYSNVSGLHKDSHGIWRGEATLKNGKPVEVVLDLQGNIYSKLAPRVYIWIRPLDQ